MKNTIKEAILKVLEEKAVALTYSEVSDKIIKGKYVDWGEAKTPESTIAARLGSFIKKNDTRVKRVKGKKGFKYYLSKYEDEINLNEIVEGSRSTKTKEFQERDLHILLSSYLNNKNIYSKTIPHEKSANSKDNHQKWIHPDMIGIKFLSLKNKSSRDLMKIVNKSDGFELTSYELKIEINSDYDLKKTYFQAVSNSSWANYGYLVAFEEISSNLKEEMERLNQSFGIGIIQLKANPFESEILFPAKSKELDFKTIDKLCKVNDDFEKFISETNNILEAPDTYLESKKKEFEKFCDKYFTTDSQSEKHCKDKNIPIGNEENDIQ